ncbi:hypothetical protein [Aeromonas caviae]|uniref:hypothetical protein n=1 Tax=Aeromonas caviae TaxID=648 RepID=UPI0016036B37|nr:hypothetical protein [Aeromonas caviae]
MMNPFSWLQMTNMISYQGLVRTFPSFLQQSASLINVELNNYGRLLSIYKASYGDRELVEFHVDKYSALICWLNVVGLLNAPLINEHVDFNVLEHVLVGNNFKDYSSAI